MTSQKPILQKNIKINDETEIVIDTPIPNQWIRAAESKGFSIEARIATRYHVALRCHRCNELTKARAFVLMSSQPRCAPCHLKGQKGQAHAAALALVAKDPQDRKYRLYRAECGHIVRRQMGFVRRVGRHEVSIRCSICMQAKEEALAEGRGWRLVGPDPSGRANYRRYRHVDCGSEQSIARVNMQSGRFDCNHCGRSWSASPSFLYAMSFQLRDGTDVVKLGYSKDPASRLTYQLLSGLTTTGKLLRTVEMTSGAEAIKAEKGMHLRLRSVLPSAIVPSDRFSDQIRVRSEVYTADALPMILAMLDEFQAKP